MESRTIITEDEYERILSNFLEDIESIKEEITEGRTKVHFIEDQFLDVPRRPQLTEPDHPDRENRALRDYDFQTLKAQLISSTDPEGSSQLLFIPIYGLVGIGKTTMALKLYNDFSIASQFSFRAWIPSYLQPNVKRHLRRILEVLGKTNRDMAGQSVDQLGAQLQNALNYRKYFIVIQDVRFIETWNKVRRFFPNDNNGSRILLIISEWKESNQYGHIKTHEQANSFGNVDAHKLDILNPEEGWMLLCHKVFGQEPCPDELKPSGGQIVRMCRGIPLLISLIAGMLAAVSRLKEFWEHVAVTLCIKSETSDTDFYTVVSALSYGFLPYYLRPCLLYAGNFPENYEIEASTMMKLWIAEGLVRKTTGNCPEDLALEYLNVLVDRNIIMPLRSNHNGKIKAFQVHRVLVGYCIAISGSANFLRPIQYWGDDPSSREYAMAMYPFGASGESGESLELQTSSRSFLIPERPSQSIIWGFLNMITLRVLDVFQLELYQFPEQMKQIILLRYLALSCHQNVPTSISRFRNLQFLIIRRLSSFRAVSLPYELWDMAQLRDVKCRETFVSYYPRRGGEQVVLRKLRALSNMQLLGVTNEFLGRIPNIRKLGIFCNIQMHTDLDLARLHNLRTLKCSSDWSLASRNFSSHLTLPASLRKITLQLCVITSELMKVVGSLPNLLSLKLRKSDFLGRDSGPTEPEWEPREGGFQQLLSLVMADLNLVHWKAHANNFPRLRHLIIQDCCEIVEIPLNIGEVKSLELIKVNRRSTPPLISSALRIKKEQRNRGNKFLQVHIMNV